MATRRHTTLGVVHVTTTPPGWEREAARVRAIHKAQGWSDIGYNEVINPNGRAEMGRGNMADGAHVAGFTSTLLRPVYGRRRRRQESAGFQFHQGCAVRHT